MIILSNGSVIKLPNDDWLNVQESQNNVETPVETPVEEEYCPNCGEIWDGVSCGNCGYPDIEDPGDDPGIDDPFPGGDIGGGEIG